MKEYDLIVIGTGWGTKLRPAADMWKKLAIIEKSELWGTCLNKWCIPSKMLIYPSDLATHMREDAQKLHIHNTDEPQIDFSTLVSETSSNVAGDSSSIWVMYEKHENITLYRWQATFLSDKLIEINGEQITAENIYIATWSIPSIPQIEWLENTPYMTSKEALRNTKLPEKMIIIGWGYIAVELWHVYWAAGCKVEFLVRSGMIKYEDKDIRDVFEKDFSQRYNVHFWISPTKVEYKDNRFLITTRDVQGNTSVMESDALLVASGVIPMTEWLWLKNTNITTNSQWYIKVDEYLQTKVPWVYALGDVVGNYLFRHSVNYEWEYLLRQHFMGEDKQALKYPPVPHAIFSYPQVAGVGLTEDELMISWKVLWIDYEIAIHHYKNSAMGSAMKSEIGFVKLIADKKTRKILGAHILWEKASDIIHMMIVLISAEETVDFMIEKMIFIHPALSEVIRNAARKLHEKL